jgi:tRNA A-37 threonylcarbamoyl transferase component Bud32
MSVATDYDASSGQFFGIPYWVFVVILVGVVLSFIVRFIILRRREAKEKQLEDEILGEKEEIDDLDEMGDEDGNEADEEADGEEYVEEKETEEKSLEDMEEEDIEEIAKDYEGWETEEEGMDESTEDLVKEEGTEVDEEWSAEEEEDIDVGAEDIHEKWEAETGEDDEKTEESPKPGAEVEKHDISYRSKLSSPGLLDVRDSLKKLIPDYYITHKIGSGGFATVYRAYDQEKNVVAIKLPKFIDETVGASVLDQFKAEADMWTKLKHENIVSFYDSDIRPVPYMVIELLEGGNLKELMDKIRIPVPEVIEIMLGLLDGLSYAHRMASVHRDIKPENILFTKDGVPKISDWGIGKFMASEGSMKSIGSKGTLAYGSPEQISKKKFGEVDWQTDVFQLGILFYEMLTGVNPFYDEDALGIVGNITGETPDLPSSINPDVPAFLDKIIMKALEKQKKDRWRSSEAMFHELNSDLKKKEEGIQKYRKSLERALRDNIITEDEDVMLAELREHFGITAPEHESLLDEMTKG